MQNCSNCWGHHNVKVEVSRIEDNSWKICVLRHHQCSTGMSTRAWLALFFLFYNSGTATIKFSFVPGAHRQLGKRVCSLSLSTWHLITETLSVVGEPDSSTGCSIFRTPRKPHRRQAWPSAGSRASSPDAGGLQALRPGRGSLVPVRDGQWQHHGLRCAGKSGRTP